MLATQRGSAHYPSMLEDVDAQRPTEIDLITGSLVREAERLGVPVPLAPSAVPADQGEGGVVVGRPPGQGQPSQGRAYMTRQDLGAIAALVAARGGCGGRRAGERRRHRRRADRDRLGVRQQGRDGAVRRPALAAAQVRVKQCQREGRRAAAASRSRPATRRATSGAPRRRAPPAAARRRREHHLHDVRRRPRGPGRAGGDQPRRAASRRASAPTRWARSASAPRAGWPSRSATSRRTRARRWPSTRGGKGWRSASLATDTVIVYFKNVVQAFEARWKQLGGKIVTKETLPVGPGGGANPWQTRSRGSTARMPT